jgi:hypothetical protein
MNNNKEIYHKNGKRKGKLLPKMKRSPEERHTQIHANLFEIF